MIKITSKEHFNKIAKDYDYYKIKNKYYYDNLKKIIGNIIPQNKRVLEIGCGTGDLINYLKPKFGYGYDISDEMISISKFKFRNSKNLIFSTIWPKEKFNYIFMSDVIEHLENPKETFCKISKLMGNDTVFVITMANPIIEPILLVAEKLGLKMEEGPHARLSTNNLKLIINSSKLKIIKHDYKLLMPIYIPFITVFINKYLERYFKRFSFVEYFIVKTE